MSAMLVWPMVLDELFQRRLVVLSGKGGVGKSVVGAALALAARARGKRILFIEVDAALPAGRYPGAGAGRGREHEVRPGLSRAHLAPAHDMDGDLPGTARVIRLPRP